MMVGARYVGAAVALSILALVILNLVSRIEQRLIDVCGFRTILLVFDPAGEKTLLRIEKMPDVHEVRMRPPPGGLMGSAPDLLSGSSPSPRIS
jgi:hypothetical protein